MANPQVKTLLARARARLEALGAVLPPDVFVCPVCLNLRPIDKANRAHYPAETIKGVHAVALGCEACNSLMGGTYEPEGVDHLNDIWHVAFGPPDGGRMSGRATIESSGGGNMINLLGHGGGGRLAANLDEMRRRSSRPHEMTFRIARPAEASALRSLLAWSFLLWTDYAGYGYAASVGARRVRELVLEPDRPIPEGVFFSQGPVGPPLAKPEPLLLVRAERPTGLQDIEEFIALGVEWGPAVIVLPFANDAAAGCWPRIIEINELATMDTVRRWPTRKMMRTGNFVRSIEDQVRIRRDGRDHLVTERPRGEDLDVLAAGLSARRVEPRRGTWVATGTALRRQR